MLEQSRPFAGQDPALLRWLAGRGRPTAYATGEPIVHAGAPGAAWYILTRGRVELIRQRREGTTDRIAELGAGEVLGAEALVTASPTPTTARALTPVEAVQFAAADFAEMLARWPESAPYFFLLARQRASPKQAPNVVVAPAPDRSGGYILKDGERFRYVRLTEPGYFLWTLLDGERTVRDLSLAYFRRYRRFGVDEVLRTIQELHDGGFVEVPDVEPRLRRLVGRSNRAQEIARRLATVTRRTFSLPDPDHVLGAVYRAGGRFVYLRAVQVVFALIALIGFGAFVHTLATGGVAGSGSVAALVSIAGLELQIVLHEAGHAMTTKHFGREVHAVGVGWYCFLPMAFVDTSDMWLESRWRRIAVAAAGPYVNVLLAGAASCVLVGLGPGPLAAPLFAFAVTGYLLGAFNLNPLYELDGYYVLSDLLDLPNLRARALADLGTLVWRAPSPVVSHARRRIFVGYGLAAVGYALMAAGLLLVGYQHLVERFVARWLRPDLAAALGWVLAGSMAGLLLVNLWQGLRRRVHRAVDLAGA